MKAGSAARMPRSRLVQTHEGRRVELGPSYAMKRVKSRQRREQAGRCTPGVLPKGVDPLDATNPGLCLEGIILHNTIDQLDH